MKVFQFGIFSNLLHILAQSVEIGIIMAISKNNYI